MSADEAWTSAENIEASLRKFWDRGRILAAKVTGEMLFPWRLRLRVPDSAALATRFGEAQLWIRTLENASRTGRGFGFDLVWREVRHRQLGRNRLPCEVIVSTETDALQLIQRQAHAKRFDNILAATATAFPQLMPWLARRPLLALEHAADWQRILTVLTWFRDHPTSGLYLRQADIPQVDTKFIETRKGLLTELLDIVLARNPRELANQLNFEARYGLRSKPSMVRFRLLDATLGLAGLTDISTPAEEFARLNFNPRTVFVTENEVNGLAFPPVRDAIVLFGLGYSLDLLASAHWLHKARIVYWGDIDTHGFAMLSRLRAHFPATESILMDEQTLLEHEALWVSEDQPFMGELSRLLAAEHSLFEDLKRSRFGNRVRLEQERITYRHLLSVLHDMDY